jgi:hypothetical protein
LGGGGGANADAVGAGGSVNAVTANHHAMDRGTMPGSRVRRPRLRLVMVR